MTAVTTPRPPGPEVLPPSPPGGRQRQAQGEVPAAPAPGPSSPPRRRVLFIDDEFQLGQTVVHLLEPGHDVSAETTASSALRRIRAGERFDVIFCDLMMPHMTGMDLHAEIARISADQASRMVFLTGGAFTDRAQAFLESPGVRWLQKPFEIDDLLRFAEREH